MEIFNPRQLLVHTQLIRAITEAPDGRWPLDVREQALGAFQQYLRNQNMFVFWTYANGQDGSPFFQRKLSPKQQVLRHRVFSTREGELAIIVRQIIEGLGGRVTHGKAIVSKQKGE